MTALACLEFMDGADVNLMGGNTKQAEDDLKIISDYYKYPMTTPDGNQVRHPLCQLTNGPPVAGEIRGINRNLLKVITSSTRGARGPHPQRVRLDEVDEMRWNVFNSSRGQPEIRANRVTGREFKDNILICSTLQYANGTMARALEEAEEKQWPVFSWCYRDTMEDIGGFLTQESVDRRKAAISEDMWIQEFELDEPMVEDRIFTFDELHFIFDGDLGIIDDEPGKYVELEKPKEGAKYVHGADWGKLKHFSIIVTLRVDSLPAKLVAFEKVNQMSYTLMANKLIRRVERYGGMAYHDSTGVGVAVNDNFVEHSNILPWTINRTDILYSPYIMAVQDNKIQSPKIDTLDTEHKYLTWKNISTKGHTPDSVCAMALAWQSYRLNYGNIQPSKKKKKGRIIRVGGSKRRDQDIPIEERYAMNDIEDRPTSITAVGDYHYGTRY